MSAVVVDDADMSRIWPPKLNGTATAPAINAGHESGRAAGCRTPARSRS